MLTRPELTTIFEDLRHLIDALDSPDLTIAESRVLLPQVYRMIGTIDGAGAMGPGVALESREREGEFGVRLRRPVNQADGRAWAAATAAR